jgi:peroxiredoxin
MLSLRTESPVLIAGDDESSPLRLVKDASAECIRELAFNVEYENFGLPFCSRRTAVVVAAGQGRNRCRDGERESRSPA